MCAAILIPEMHLASCLGSQLPSLQYQVYKQDQKEFVPGWLSICEEKMSWVVMFPDSFPTWINSGVICNTKN